MPPSTDIDQEMVELVSGKIPSVEHRVRISELETRASAIYNAFVELCNGVTADVKVYQVDRELIIGHGPHSLNIPLIAWLKSGAIRQITIEGV
jgi:hypothetical protein